MENEGWMTVEGKVSRINDDMLVGAIAASASLWITGITIAVCYLMIRR
jgi:hypothetical protein